MFLTQSEFQHEIEELVWAEDITYMEAVLFYCDLNSVEPEDILGLISPNLKDKIKMDAVSDGLIKQEAMLPL
jgi:hypothetical protein